MDHHHFSQLKQAQLTLISSLTRQAEFVLEMLHFAEDAIGDIEKFLFFSDSESPDRTDSQNETEEN
jgi:hypothetical protein